MIIKGICSIDLQQMQDENKEADDVCHEKSEGESYWKQTWQIDLINTYFNISNIISLL